MAELWTSSGGVNRKQKELWLPQGGVNRKQKELWAGSGGVNRRVFSAGVGYTLLLNDISDNPYLKVRPTLNDDASGNFYYDLSQNRTITDEGVVISITFAGPADLSQFTSPGFLSFDFNYSPHLTAAKLGYNLRIYYNTATGSETWWTSTKYLDTPQGNHQIVTVGDSTRPVTGITSVDILLFASGKSSEDGSRWSLSWASGALAFLGMPIILKSGQITN